MATHVNLDALIPREDFEAAADEMVAPASLTTTMKISDLGAENIAYTVLRKPDFQRETANWTPEKVAELVNSFLEGDLIPSVILWRSPSSGSIFVIDGAHRLSALIAWVQDDYGDSHASLRFFDSVIPDEQKKAADATRKLIDATVGSYKKLSAALRNSDTVPKEQLRLARNMHAFAIHLQWVQGEAEKAESSFFRINQKATPIDQTELDMIRARRKPNALAARAFIRAGTGHKYWSGFSGEKKEEIERIAKEVYDLLFKPSLDSPIKTGDLPVAGRGYSADSVRMVFELVNFVNDIHPETWREDREDEGKKRRSRKTVDPSREPLADDVEGDATLKCMRAVRKVATRVSGNLPSSLGLHPAVYFYSATGRFQPAAFLATVELIQDLEKRGKLREFTSMRARFEEFLVEYKYFLNQLVRRYGSLQKSVAPMLAMYQAILNSVHAGRSGNDIVQDLKKLPALEKTIEVLTEEDRKFGPTFSGKTKTAIYLKSALERAERCGICGARLSANSATVDHIVRKQDGGLGTPSNGQLSHPYCNSGFKESGQALLFSAS
ncbi:HNH endonuclease family protein [Lentzea terrae]|uniref:HNH endonuclease family protein n=1 Tax=Lentzea terrae TaxID=2200761 RepID=UPI000DD4170F|nr:DUF262 domain-containing protein [Lentzea terrae]